MKGERTIRLHTCCVCGTEAEWSESWSWWGSMFSHESGHVLRTCSDKCRKKVPDPEKLFLKTFGRKPNSRYYRV